MSDKKLGVTVTAFLKLKQKATKKQKEVDEIKEQARVLEGEIIKVLEADTKTTRADVKIGSVTYSKENVWNVKDWKKVWKYIFKTKDTAILSHQRMSNTLLREYLKEGIKIPGTEKMIKKKLTVGYKRGI